MIGGFIKNLSDMIIVLYTCRNRYDCNYSMIQRLRKDSNPGGVKHNKNHENA